MLKFSNAEPDIQTDFIPAPVAVNKILLSKQEFIELKQQANYWQAMWNRARYREQIALATISKLKTDNATIVAEFKSQFTNLKSELAHKKMQKIRLASHHHAIRDNKPVNHFRVDKFTIKQAVLLNM